MYPVLICPTFDGSLQSLAQLNGLSNGLSNNPIAIRIICLSGFLIIFIA